MAASGPSQRKSSISTLVYSTLGPSLGLLRDEDKSDWVVLDSEKSTIPEGASVTGGSDLKEEAEATRPQRPSATSVDDELAGSSKEPINKPNPDSTGDVLSRLYSAPSSFGQKSRFGFASKSGAGSIGSMEQATVPGPVQTQGTEEGQCSGTEPPMSPVSKQLQNHISPKSSVGEPIPSSR